MTSYVAKRQKPLVVVDAAAAKKRTTTTSTSMNAQRMCAAISSRSKDVERVVGWRVGRGKAGCAHSSPCLAGGAAKSELCERRERVLRGGTQHSHRPTCCCCRVLPPTNAVGACCSDQC
ncbi:hypothetical protein L3Y34_004307 [Caenorhabditis briggsae]|nr:hypothetical protein L3Y34_004307 [Caenorhabditis briggsae]